MKLSLIFSSLAIAVARLVNVTNIHKNVRLVKVLKAIYRRLSYADAVSSCEAAIK